MINCNEEKGNEKIEWALALRYKVDLDVDIETNIQNRAFPSKTMSFGNRLRPAGLLKRRLWHRCFPVNFAKFLRTPFLQNTSGRLLLFHLFLMSITYGGLRNTCYLFTNGVMTFRF